MTNPCGSMCPGNALIQRLVQRMMRAFTPTSMEKILKYEGKALIHEAQVDGICAQSESLRWWRPCGVAGRSPCGLKKEIMGMQDGLKKRTVKDIQVNVDKCTGCRACELACSAFHAMPKYSGTNPAKARIHVMIDELEDVYVPIRAGYYSPVECTGRYAYTINGKTYTECGFCRVACRSRIYFIEPDSGLPLRCDMCEADPPLEAPMCVQVCPADALIYTEREEVGDEAAVQQDLDVGLKRLAEKHGLQKIVRILDRMSKRS